MTGSAIRSIAWRDGRLFAGETGGAERDRADSPAHIAAVFPSLPGGYDAPARALRRWRGLGDAPAPEPVS